MTQNRLICPEPDATAVSWKDLVAGGLPSDFQRRGAVRLSWLCVIYAVAFSLAFFPGWISMFLAGQVNFGFSCIAAIVSIISALAVALFAWRRSLSPQRLELFGRGFGVVGAFGIGIAEYGHLFYHNEPGTLTVLGLSWICPWLIVFPLVLPGTPVKVLVSALLTASMGPLALACLWIASSEQAFPENLIPLNVGLHFLASYICVGIAVIVSNIIYRLGCDVRRHRELGSYHLDSLLGRGGMGEVWKARHRLLIRPAAIKLIRKDRLGDSDEVVKRFEREAQATAVLRSPHTVELYDFGVADDGALYYVMELLDGLSMETLVERFGPQPSARVAFLLRQACHSLQDAHKNGLVHRDIKPANIFVCRFGEDHDFVKVLDFGLVKSKAFKDLADTRLTVEGSAAGTPAYFAPEMAIGKRSIDARVDIYALGCVGYWLLTGQLVFEGESAMELIVKHASEAPIPPSARVEISIDEGLERVILRCLEKKPEDRPQDAKELADLLKVCKCQPKWDEEDALNWWNTHLPVHVDSDHGSEISDDGAGCGR